MNMQTAVITCFKKYLTIKGRASRSEFWWFILFVIAMGSLLRFFVNVPLFEFRLIESSFSLWFIITILPQMCVTIRRFHDVNISGWWVICYHLFFFAFLIMNALFEDPFPADSTLFVLIIGAIFGVIIIATIFIGIIAGLIFLCKKGTEGKNRFGEDPLTSDS